MVENEVEERQSGADQRGWLVMEMMGPDLRLKASLFCGEWLMGI